MPSPSALHHSYPSVDTPPIELASPPEERYASPIMELGFVTIYQEFV